MNIKNTTFMKKIFFKTFLPLLAVILVGVAVTSCEKEMDEEKVEHYTYEYDGGNFVNLTICWHLGKYYTEVTNNLERVKFLFDDDTWERFRLDNDMMYVKETYFDGINSVECETPWELHFVSDTVFQMVYGASLPADGSNYFITTYNFVKRKQLQ